jgi:hypothetical protein
MSNISKHTNVFLDGEVLGYNPDADGDFYKITDYGRDFTYLQEKIAYAVRGLMGQSDQDFVILYGGEVTDSGSGQVDISEGLAIGKDTDSNLRFVPIPALSNVPLPSGWNDGRQIWVVGEHLFKLSTDTRNHKQTSAPYHYTVEDSYLGETDSDDLFVAADPGGSQIIWGSFTMTGTTFASLDAGERSNGNLILNQKLALGYDTSGNAIINNTENTDLILSTNNTPRAYIKNDGGLAVGTDAVKGAAGVVHIANGTNADTNWSSSSPLVVERNATAYINIRTPNNANGGILFSDPDAIYKGQIYYSHTSDFLEFTGNSGVMRLNSTGLYIGGSANPSNPLHVQSTTTPQVRIAYDGSSYLVISISSTGLTTFQNTGTGNINLLAAGGYVQLSTGNALRVYSNDNAEYATIFHNGSNLSISTGGASAGDIVISNTTNSSSSTTGALIVGSGGNGGLGVAEDGYFGGQVVAGTGITATTGNIVATAGNIVVNSGYFSGEKQANLISWSTSDTENDVYDELTPYTPVENITYTINGGILVSGTLYPVIDVRRTSTTVTIRYTSASGGISNITADDGDGTSMTTNATFSI